jgi:hypothetical protein
MMDWTTSNRRANQVDGKDVAIVFLIWLVTFLAWHL